MRGGRRPGAGRRRGSPNAETIRRAEAIAAAGITPKQYLLNGLGHYQGIITAEMAKGTKADQGKIAAAYAAGKEFAKDVAPYVHPRLAAMELAGKDGGPVEVTTDARDVIARRLAGIAARVGADRRDH